MNDPMEWAEGLPAAVTVTYPFTGSRYKFTHEWIAPVVSGGIPLWIVRSKSGRAALCIASGKR